MITLFKLVTEKMQEILNDLAKVLEEVQEEQEQALEKEFSQTQEDDKGVK